MTAACLDKMPCLYGNADLLNSNNKLTQGRCLKYMIRVRFIGEIESIASTKPLAAVKGCENA